MRSLDVWILRSMIGHLPLGQADYATTLDLQRRLHERRCAHDVGDLILSVEHNPVITLGRSGSRNSILASGNALDVRGIAVHEIERGGDVTYHGPGQLVLYPIVDLRRFGKNIAWFVRSLEDATLRALQRVGVHAQRRAGFPGVWVGERKIASLGIYVKRWVTYHGLAVNVHVDPDHFRLIHPCGLSVEAVSVNDLVVPPVTVLGMLVYMLRELETVWSERIGDVLLEEVGVAHEQTSLLE